MSSKQDIFGNNHYGLQVSEIVAYSYNYKFLLTYSFWHAIIFQVLTSGAATHSELLRPAHNQHGLVQYAAEGIM